MQRIYAETFDLVFMDLGLPDIDGLDFLTRLGPNHFASSRGGLVGQKRIPPRGRSHETGGVGPCDERRFRHHGPQRFLGRLTETFRLKRENAELHQVGQMKNDFLATISHELRTPLTSILGLSELILAGRMGPLGDKQADGLRKVIEQSQNLSRLINQLLDVQDTIQSRSRQDLRPVADRVG
jgi:signal transduction histidine kinase